MRRRRRSCWSRSRSKAWAGPSALRAEFLVPKWFDKRPHLTPEETVEELRCSLKIARELYLAHRTLIPPSDCTRPASLRRSSCARKRISRRWQRLRAGRDRQGDPRCAAALRRAPISSTAWRKHRRDRCAAVARPRRRRHRAVPRGRRRLERVAIRHTVGLDDAIEGEGGVADARKTPARAISSSS